MIKLIESNKCWGTNDFPHILKMEIIRLGANNLPLQKAVTPGSFVNDSDIGVTVLSACDDENNIKAKIGVMFSEVLWAYCCGDDEPMVSNAYCEAVIVINKITSITKFRVVIK